MASEFLVPAYRTGSVLPQGQIPTSQGIQAPAGAFGASGAQLQQAGEGLGKTADNIATVEQKMAADANQTRVQQDVDKFMSASDASLFTDPDAFFKKKGQNAIDGASDATAKLTALRDSIVGDAANADQKNALNRMLGAQLIQLRGQISRHVGTEFGSLQEQVAKGSIDVARNKATLNYNDSDITEAMVMRAEGAAKSLASQRGVTGTPEEEAMVSTARGQVLGDVINSRLQNNDKRGALGMYDKVKDRLDFKTAETLGAAMKSTRTDVAADDLIDRTVGKALPTAVQQYSPLILKSAGEAGVRPQLAAGVMAQESQGNQTGPDGKTLTSKAGAQGLMQLMPGTAKDLGVDASVPEQNIKGGVSYLGQQLKAFNGDERLALMAYNWGPKNVENWQKAGSKPEAVPDETKDYVQKVLGYAGGVGFDKANTEGIRASIMADPHESLEVRTAAAAKVEKYSSATEAARTAQIKGLRDTAEATTMAMIVSPNSVPKGRLSEIADGFDQAGEKSEALSTRLLAQNEDLLRNFMTTTDSGQRRIMAAMLSGKSKALADGLISADEKGGTEAAKTARDNFTAMKEAAANGVDVVSMKDKIADTITKAQQGNDKGALAREVYDWANAQGAAQAASKKPLPEFQATMNDLKTRIESGDQANGSLLAFDLMRKAQQQQASAFDKDALAAGSSLYSTELGPLPKVTDLAGRAAYAQQVSARRGGIDVSPFTEAEFADMRGKLANQAPEQQAQMFRQLSILPPDQIPRVAAGIAGKPDASDPQSRMYAAALSFYAEKDPAHQQVGDQILRGAQITKDMGEAGKKAAVSSDAWQQALQTKMGNAFVDMGGKVPAVIADAVQGVYTYQMHQAGRQGDKLDTDMLNSALDAVVGKTVTRNGQMMLPPKGVDAYQFDSAIRTLSDGDIDGFKTLNGSPVTADKVIRYGSFTNSGKDGQFFVQLPDPANGDKPGYVMKPDGQPYVLDIKPLLERAQRFPDAAVSTGSSVETSRRRAPASPTEGVSP